MKKLSTVCSLALGMIARRSKPHKPQKQQNPTFSGWVLKVMLPVGETNSHSLGETDFEPRMFRKTGSTQGQLNLSFSDVRAPAF